MDTKGTHRRLNPSKFVPILYVVLLASIQALEGREKQYRHAYAMEVRPESLPGDSFVIPEVVEVSQGCMQPRDIAGLDGVGSML